MEPTAHPRQHRSFVATRNGRLASAFAAFAALVAAGFLAFIVLYASPTGGGPVALPGTFAPFTADVATRTEASVEQGRLHWQDARNWRFDTFDQADSSRVINSQRVESGRLTITTAGFGDTHFPEATDRVPGEWFVASSTALGRGGVRVPGDRPVFRQTVSRPCAEVMAQA